MSLLLCKICASDTKEIGEKYGRYSRRWYRINRCPVCHFSFVANPWIEYEKIYSADYYAGKGADPLVDYLFELQYPEVTTRQYEWAGILDVISSLVQVNHKTSWLDFGCGNGGLVRYVLERTSCRIVGFDEGWITQRAAMIGIPVLQKHELTSLESQFDIITAIEVLEHIVDPVETLQLIRRLLKPGGLFFFTTGNARQYRNRLTTWSYLIPEIHVSFFEPETAAIALRNAGFRVEWRGYIPGFTNIIRFKVLKSLRIRKTSLFERTLPWEYIARFVDSRMHVTAHPIGWAI